ncbi:hypothetical protein [Roseospira visakhapatnamensis]|uniref:Uncharacterized protein n=1 Tax=Roseospira visakhapatnamensis TaxID=390880 RepID=A0A7W6RH16_9PROT|nr:hypothetical protein [Roseospira visakhapatnamensis]MBB4267718.1 hypothetical protein [Roseospira visakhapatnamensis]
MSREITSQDVTAMMAAGASLARDHGMSDPCPETIAWELLIEAADTLKCLPDRERGWLASCDRSAWPPVLIEQAERWAAAVARGGWDAMTVRPGPPSAAAIERMDTLFRLTVGFPRPLDLRRAFLLASGVPAHLIARHTKCSRRTVFNARDRSVAVLAERLDNMSKNLAA